MSALLAGLAALALLLWGGWRLRRAWVLVRVDGQSMAPALADGQRVLARRVAGTGFRRQDVVGFRQSGVSRPRPGAAYLPPMLKRVVAVAGDDLPPWARAAEWGRFLPFVPAGHLLVLGDNSLASLDSRELGLVDASAVFCVLRRRRAQSV